MFLHRISDRFVWLVNRFRCMSPGEVMYRFSQVGTVAAMRCGWLAFHPPSEPALDKGQDPYRVPPGVAAEAYIKEADEILAGDVILFANRRFHVGPIPQWNRDPLTGTLSSSSFGPSIPITRREVVGDIKHVWELSRHLHLVRLAQAYCLSGEDRYLQGLGQQLRAWLDQCPVLIGPNWTSALELGIRLINWSLLWQMIGGAHSPLFQGEKGQRLRHDWLASVYGHCQFIRRNFSRHSSANNHLIGELTGLYVASRTWPFWPETDQWAQQAKRELEREATLQHSADGVNREHAFSYQVFTLEFLLIAGIAAQRGSDSMSPEYWHVISKSLHFLRSVRNSAGIVPMVGDADDGMATRVEPGADGDRAGMVLAVGNTLLYGIAPTSDAARWLVGNVKLDTAGTPALADQGWNFEDGGYFLFGSDFGGRGEVKGMVDCGPLGYLGIAAHGHADAMSLILSLGGEPCLVDPGTYSYWNELRWREYFRGTRAHNTVTVDDLDQSLSGGRFMWTRKANCRITRQPQQSADFDLVAEHDGYRRLTDPVTHQRNVRYSAAGQWLTIRDEVAGRQSHHIAQHWHFAPHLIVERIAEDTVLVKGKRFTLEMKWLGASFDIDIVRGDDTTPLGWYSKSYEAKEPCPVVRVTTCSSTVDLTVRATWTWRKEKDRTASNDVFAGLDGISLQSNCAEV